MYMYIYIYAHIYYIFMPLFYKPNVEKLITLRLQGYIGHK